MKPRLQMIALAISFLTVLTGAYLLNSMGEAPLPAVIKFDPNFVEWNGGGPSTWYVWIQAPQSAWNARYVDGASVMFEHVLPAKGGHYETGKWVAEFDGQAVFDILCGQVGHMGIPPDISTKTPVHYYFTVSGTLTGAKGYPDGTPFEGEGWIAVRFVHGFPIPLP